MSKPIMWNKQAYKEKFKKPKGRSWPIYVRLISYGKPYFFVFCLAVIGNAVYAGVDSLFIYLMKPLLDKGFVQPNASILAWIPIVAIGLFIVRALASLTATYYMGYVGRQVILNMRQQIFSHLMKMPCSFYDRSSSGTLLSMIVYNASQVASACTDAITKLIQSACMVIGLLLVMFSISWQMSLMFFLFMPIMALVIRFSSKRLRRLNRKVQESMGKVTHSAEEAIEGYKVVRMFGGEAYEKQRFDKAATKNLTQELKIIITKSLGTSLVQLFWR